MRVTARALAMLVILPGTAALNAVRADDSGTALKVDVGTAHAAEIYSHICQGCHMAKREGAVGAGRYPALAADPSLVSWEYVAITILRGRSDMPAFGVSAEQALRTRSVRLDDADVAAVVNYVRQHFGNHYQKSITAQDVARLPHPETDGDVDL